MPMQIRRTATPNLPPPGLAEGQLGVEMAGVRPRLWIGVPTAVDASGRRLLVPSGAVSSATAPATPQTGDLWYDTTNNLLNYFDGTAWEPLVSDAPSDGTMYARQDGAWIAVPIPEPTPDAPVVAVGGLMSVLGSSPSNQIIYRPHNGAWIRIDGTDHPLPATGVTGDATNATIDGVGGQVLAASTVYYVYLFDNAGTLAVEFSTVGRQTSTQAGNAGVEIKLADNSRTLIGIVFTDTAAPWLSDTPGKRYVSSWLNRSPRSALQGFAGLATQSTTPAVLATMSFVMFEGDTWGVVNGPCLAANNPSVLYLAIRFDADPFASGSANVLGGQYTNLTATQIATLADGNHVAQIGGAIESTPPNDWFTTNCTLLITIP